MEITAGEEIKVGAPENIRLVTTTAASPFATSKVKTIAAAKGPRTLSVLVNPILPLP